MAEEYIKRIRTNSGDKQIDYESLANLPELPAEFTEESTEKQLASAKAVYDHGIKVKGESKEEANKLIKEAQQLYSNAITGNASGEVIRVDDVSPMEHTVKAKVSGKNLVDVSKIIGESKSDKTIIQKDGNDIVFSALDGNVYGLAIYNTDIGFEIGKVYTASVGSVSEFDSSSYGWRVRYTDGTTAKLNNGLTCSFLIEKEVDMIVFRIGSPYQGNKESRVTNIQIEEGTTATEYEPYIDPATVTVTRCGKNLLGFNQSFTETWGGVTIDYDNETQIFTLNGTYTHTAGGEQTILVHRYMDNRPKIGIDTMTTLTIEKVGGSISAEDAYNVVYLSCADSPNGARSNWHAVVLPTSKNTRSKAATNDYLNSMWFYISRDVTFTDYKVRIQVELDDVSTEYEPYNAETYTPSADGVVEIPSVSPTMTLLTDTAGVIIEAEYNRDANAVMEEVNKYLAELDRVTSELAAAVGAPISTLYLTDDTTGKTHEVYVSNGKLMMNESEM